jgi:hypothetical protein
MRVLCPKVARFSFPDGCRFGKDAAILNCAGSVTRVASPSERSFLRSAVAAALARIGRQFGIWDLGIGMGSRIHKFPIPNPQSPILRLLISILLFVHLAVPLRAAVDLPVGDPTQPIGVRAGGATHWRQGAYEVWVLRGGAEIKQGSTAAKSDEAVLWVDRAEAFSERPSKVIAYLEGHVVIDFGPGGDLQTPATNRKRRL